MQLPHLPLGKEFSNILPNPYSVGEDHFRHQPLHTHHIAHAYNICYSY